MADYQSSHSGPTIDTRVSQVATNTADIAALKSRMNSAEADIDTKADSTTVTALSSQIGGVEAKIPSAATTSNKLADKAYVDSSVSGKASQSDLTNLTNRVTAVETNKVDKVSGKGLSTNDYTTAEKNKVASIGNLNDLETEDKSSIVAAINEAATTGSGGGATLTGYVVVDSIANLPDPGQPTLGYLVGTHLYLYVGTGGDTKGGKYQDAGEFRGPQGVGFQSVASQQDGTVVITLTNGDTITIDLNHNHPQYPKYVYLTSESQMPASPDSSTLYLIAEQSN